MSKSKTKYDISIITPTLNAEKYISFCINSIQSQKNIKVQHIIVDGGSNDQTLEIIKKKNISELYYLKDSSIYEALNFGVNKADSKIVGFLNADDQYITSLILFNIVQKFIELESSKVIYGNCRYVNEKGKLLYKLISPKNLNYDIAKKRIFNISHPTWFIKKRIFQELGGFDTNLKFISDCDLIIRALKKEVEFNYLNQDISNFLIHSDNKSNTTNAKKEFTKYLITQNGKSIFCRIENYIFLICMYIKDIRYFIYKINKFFKKLIYSFYKIF